jgi:hypothetical protein
MTLRFVLFPGGCRLQDFKYISSKNMWYGLAPTLGMIPDTVIPEGELCASRRLFLIGRGKNSTPRY